MFIRAYLRASTQEQDATRAASDLESFAIEHGVKIASKYVENFSGTKLDRPELRRLLADAHDGDVVLVEAIDRLTRLTASDWDELKTEIKAKHLKIVAVDLPTSYMALSESKDSDPFTGSMLAAVNGMLIDMLAAISRKDYEVRRTRQAQGIKAAKSAGKYPGRPVDTEKHERIGKLLDAKMSYSDIQKTVKCSRATIAAVRKG